ncbi:MAG: hypothetical protein P4L72_17005 [Parvibaculum sp.]|uniref:hypothetical protein n=1 Tax=Parvibaculum sp. TaxID=2024848 RepID=UPI002847D2D2|nr:hypothetical protein [Parvibaculum sp.]MDR3500915.1 hypothetical protein [Parvibaculum sp.]
MAVPTQVWNVDADDIHKGISHHNLTVPAHQKLIATLTRHGNDLDQNHKDVLLALVGSMTEMAQGKIEGRYAFGLPTGFGKTSAVTSWVSTLYRPGSPRHHLSISIAASKVEALCDVQRELIRAGVPAELISLIHSYKGMDEWQPGMEIPEGFASIPATLSDEDRPIVLVTHNKVRGDAGLNRFASYRGRPRDLMLYDESLIISDSTGINITLLRGALGWFREVSGDTEKYAEVISYLTNAIGIIQTELDWQQQSGTLGGVISLPVLDHETELKYVCLLPTSNVMEPAVKLLSLHRSPLRVVSTAQGGVVQYDISVPRELGNILVLDASYPIRSLIHLDATIRDAETSLDVVKRIGVPFSHLKSFENVNINQMFTGGGRATLGEDFLKPQPNQRMTKEIAEVVKSIPPAEAILIFTYKKRPGDRVNFKGILTSALERAGIDVRAKLADGKSRVNIVTWGMETNLNNYAHCSTVILAGVLQRSPIDLTASFIGQSDDLQKPILTNVLRELGSSEVTHMIYQALSRGSCRVMQAGKAKPMTAYIVHRYPAIRGALEKVMPKAKWCEWSPLLEVKSHPSGLAATTATKVVEFLGTLSNDQNSISTTALRKSMKLSVSPAVYVDAIRKVTQMCAWQHSGRSLVRQFHEVT